MALVLLLVLFLTATIRAQSDFQLSYIAEQMEQYCNLRFGSVNRPQTPIAAPTVGKSGPRGPKGPPGPATQVDYSRIESLIDRKLSAAKEQISELKNELQVFQRMKEGLCKVEYQGRCFWAVIRSVPNLQQALSLCEDKFGHGANFYDATQYEMLRNYLATVTANLNLYTGINYNPETGILSFSNGTRSDFSPWYPNHPKRASGRTSIGFTSRSDPNAKNLGIWTLAPDAALHGVICEL